MARPPYHYVRFRWWNRVDLKEVAKELGETFVVEEVTMPRDKNELSLYEDERNELEVKADTLKARISQLRAILYQSEPAPFTERDMELRRKILKVYPRSRPTPLPFEFGKEPKFETET